MYCFVLPQGVPLGDEMSMYRNALFELAALNIIDHESTIVTHPDRFFLYDFYFKVAEKEDTTKKIVNTHAQVPWPVVPPSSITEVRYFPIFPNYKRLSYFNNMKEPQWVKLVTSFTTFENMEKKKEPFILVHYRNKNFSHHVNFDENFDILSFLVTNIRKRNHNVIIFGNVDDEWKRQHDDCCFTNNLQHYCTLLRDESCSHIISQWSGGGQISGYVGHPLLKVLYYFNPLQLDSAGSNFILDDIRNNSSINLLNNSNWFDAVNPMQLERYFFKSYLDIDFNLL